MVYVPGHSVPPFSATGCNIVHQFSANSCGNKGLNNELSNCYCYKDIYMISCRFCIIVFAVVKKYRFVYLF